MSVPILATSSRSFAADKRDAALSSYGFRLVRPLIRRGPSDNARLVFPRWKKAVDRIGEERAVQMIVETIARVECHVSIAQTIDEDAPPVVFVRTTTGGGKIAVVFPSEESLPEHGRTPRYVKGDVVDTEIGDFFEMLRNRLDQAAAV